MSDGPEHDYYVAVIYGGELHCSGMEPQFFSDSLPRAIIEAWVEALESVQTGQT